MTRLLGFDLETTSTDTETCGVVQAAYVDALLVDMDEYEEDTSAVVLCSPGFPIPPGSTAVHGITDADVEGLAHFAGYAGQLLDYADGATLVTFNGLRFDAPIWERFAGRKIRMPHVDVWRLHQLAKMRDDVFCTHVMSDWPASAFAGSLLAAHVFWCGETFDGAHDALVDVRATLAVLEAMHDTGFVDSIEHAVEISSTPFPGDVDMEGKFRWDDDGEAAFAFGKHRGCKLRDPDCAGFIRWMLRADFPEETKTLCRAALRGDYPRKTDT